MENNVMEQAQETKKTLFSVEQNGFTSYYDMGVMSFEELRQHFMESEHPFMGLGGKELSEADFAQMEQSDMVSLSVTADIDNDMIKVYEINGIAEEERTRENTRIWEMELSEYISPIKQAEINTLPNPMNSISGKGITEKQDAMGQAEEIINRLESTRTVFDSDERNLIVNYAYKLNDIEKTRELAEHIFNNHGNQEAILAKDKAQAEIDALPDPMLGISQMNEYGYTNKDMLPLTQEGAMELFEQNLSVYVLHKDGMETMVEDREQIMEHAGIFGIEKDEWLQMHPQKEIRETANQNKSQEQTEKKNSMPEQLNKKETVTLKFGKGYVGKQFQGKDGNQYREILVPPDNDRSWATFVVKADHLHESKSGKSMFIKLPAKGNTTIRWSVDISPKDSQIKEWLPQQEKIPNTTLKNMMEKYKERPKESVMQTEKKESILNKLKSFQNKAKEQNEAKEIPTRSKETSISK